MKHAAFRRSFSAELRYLLPWLAGLLLAFLMPASLALAHEGLPPMPHDVWDAWSWDLLLLVGLGLSGWAYVRGVTTLWRRAGLGRGVTGWQAAAFGGGLIALFIALISPLDALSEALFSAHMVQHVILILVAAPLLVLGAPPAALIWSVPRRWQRGLGRWWQRQRGLRAGWRILTQPLLVWTLHTLALWAWHVPALYQAALQNETLHALEHLSFFGTGLLFWRAIMSPFGRKKVATGPGRLLYIFTMALQSGGLGALMTFSPRPWYGTYTSTTTAWGLTPLEDQQLAGVIMWVPAGVVYLVAALVLLGSWLQALERQDNYGENQRQIVQMSKIPRHDTPIL